MACIEELIFLGLERFELLSPPRGKDIESEYSAGRRRRKRERALPRNRSPMLLQQPLNVLNGDAGSQNSAAHSDLLNTSALRS